MLDFSALDNLKTGHAQRAWYYFAGAIAALYAGLSALAFSGIATALLFSLSALLIVLTIYQYVKGKTIEDENKASYLTFAQRNNFEYSPAAESILNGTGTLFTHGHGKVTKHVLSGKTASGLPLQAFHYEYVTGSGKNSQTHYASVMRITLPRTLPHMVIDSLVEGSTTNSVLPINFDQSQRVTVEGDFNKYFSLYAPDTYAISMLSIIGPDVMWALMQHAAACDIEIIDNYIYFYWPFTAARRAEYESMFATADAVMKEVGRKLVQGNIYTSDSQAQLHSTAQLGGVRLKSGASRMAILTIIFIGVVYAEPFLTQFFGIPPVIAPPIILLAGLAFVGFAVFDHVRTQKRRQELTHRFSSSAPKHP